MANLGRPRKIQDEETRKQALAILSVGGSRRDACRFLGIADGTFGRELKRDKGFRSAVIEAEGAIKITCLTTVKRAAGKDWKAAAWYLEKRFPAQFGKYAPRLGESETEGAGDISQYIGELEKSVSEGLDG